MGSMLPALAVLAGDYVFLAVASFMTVLAISEAHDMGGVPALLGNSFLMPAVCPCSDLTPLFGTMLPLWVGFGRGVCWVCPSSWLGTEVG